MIIVTMIQQKNNLVTFSFRKGKLSGLTESFIVVMGVFNLAEGRLLGSVRKT